MKKSSVWDQHYKEEDKKGEWNEGHQQFVRSKAAAAAIVKAVLLMAAPSGFLFMLDLSYLHENFACYVCIQFYVVAYEYYQRNWYI